MPRPQQNEDAASDREIELRRHLERDRLLRRMAEQNEGDLPGPGATAGGGKGGGQAPKPKPPANPAADTREVVKKVQLRLKFWYAFYYVLPLFAIVGLKLKDDEWMRKKAAELTKSGGAGGGDGGSGCTEFLVSKIDSCLMVEWCCACGLLFLVFAIIAAVVALLAVIGCSALELVSFVGLGC